MSNFDWQTEEEETWESWAEPPEIPPFPPKRRNFWLYLTLLMVIVIGLSSAYFQLADYADDEAAARRAHVRAAHQLLLTAVEDKDVELFRTLIERNRYPWLRDQEKLVEMGFFLGREVVDLPRFTAVAAPPTINNIHLNDTLDEAYLFTIETFQHTTADGRTRGVELEQIYPYRLVNGRWLLGEPSADFWGALTVPLIGQYVTIENVYTADLPLAEQLLPDFDQQIGRLCHSDHITCPADFHLNIIFDTTPHLLTPPAYLTTQEQSWPPNTYDQTVVLPTPTLIGRPTGTVSYAAVRDGYNRHLLTAAITNLTHYQCCEHLALYQAFLTQELEQLGLGQAPLVAADYHAFFEQPFPLADSLNALNRTPFDPRIQQQAQLLARYLIHLSQQEPLVLQQQLLAGASITELLGGREPARLTADFVTFIYDHLSPPASPLPLPEETIEAICLSPETLTHYAYEPRTDRWYYRDEFPEANLVNLHILADGRGRLWDIRGGEGRSSQQLSIQYDNQDMRAIYETDNLTLNRLAIRWAFPHAENLVMANVAPMRPLPTYVTLNTRNCATGNCHIQTMTGIPVWSPDGQHVIIIEEQTLWLADAEAQILRSLGRGTWPLVWLDGQTYAYTDVDADGRPHTLQLATLDGPQTAVEPLLRWSDLPLPPQANGDWQVTVATVVPEQDKWLLFQRHFYYGNIADTFLYNWQTKEVKPLMIDDPFGYPLFSPDGRWLVWQSRGTAASYLFNIDTAEQVHTYPNPALVNNNNTHYFDWSADGEWLLRFDQGFMTLNAPAYKYAKIVPYPAGTQLCTSGGWIDSTPTAEPRVLEKSTRSQGTCCLR